MAKNTNLSLASASEIAITLGARLKEQRLVKKLRQDELAARAGVSRHTIVAMEREGKVTLESFLRVVMTLGLQGELESLFQHQRTSIADIEKANALPTRVYNRRSS